MPEQMYEQGSSFDVEKEVEKFLSLKRSQYYIVRNFNYFLLREAMEGRFRWPAEWPKHKPKLIYNLVKRISMRYSSLLTGKGFQVQVPVLAPNDMDLRLRSQGVEKLCYRFIEKSGDFSTFSLGSQDGSLLGNTVFKTYIDQKTKWPSFSQCIPDYFYGISSSVNYAGELAKVFYTYKIDIDEARELYGNLDFKGDMDYTRDIYLSKEMLNQSTQEKERQVPCLEVWTKDNYMLKVGNAVVYNGANPYGFVPFVSIPNIRKTGRVEGLSDVDDVLPVNEELNQMLSHRAYVVRRWLNPTLIWEGAPKDYAAIIQKIVGGGGVIPTRLGAKLNFLALNGQGPDVIEMLERLRLIALENANMNDLALSGNVQGSINTGQSLDRMLISIITTLEEKHRNWERGLKKLFGQLLTLSTHEEAAKEYGEVQVNADKKSAEGGGILTLDGELVGDIRDVKVIWPGTLARDDAASVSLELQKYQAGVQSLYTTLENLGVDFPDDEIEKIASERSDPRLAPKEQASLLKAASPLLAQEQQAQQEQLPPEAFENPEEEAQLALEEEESAPKRRRRKRAEPTEPEVTFDNSDEPSLAV
jgi:hypothetical protein